MLRHLARYHLSFTEIIRHVPCKGNDPEETIRSLKSGNFITTREGYGGRRVAYVLAPRGASAVGAGRRAGEEAGPVAEAQQLAVFSYCFLMKMPRARLSTDELAELFGAGRLPGLGYCMEYAEKRKRIDALYTPGPSTSPAEVASTLRNRVGNLWQYESLRSWLLNGVLAVCATVSDDERAAQISARLEEMQFQDRPLSDFADVNVHVIPGREDLAEALRVFA